MTKDTSMTPKQVADALKQMIELLKILTVNKRCPTILTERDLVKHAALCGMCTNMVLFMLKGIAEDDIVVDIKPVILQDSENN